MVEDFRITTEKSGSGGIGGECSNVGEAYINASTSSVDGLVQPVSMMTKKANVKTVVSRFKGRYVCLFAYLLLIYLFVYFQNKSQFFLCVGSF